MDSSLNIRGATAMAPRADKPATSGKDSPVRGDSLPAAAAPAPTPEQVEQAVRQIQSYLSDSQRQLKFQVDQDTGRTVVRVLHPETNELIRQIPSEEVLTLARAMGNQGGRLFSQLA